MHTCTCIRDRMQSIVPVHMQRYKHCIRPVHSVRAVRSLQTRLVELWKAQTRDQIQSHSS